MPTCADIFNALPGRFNPEAAGQWETLIQFNVAGQGGGNWVLAVKSGKCEIKDGQAEGATATVTTDADTWVGINTGKVNPMVAFTTGKLKVQGNMMDIMKLQNPQIFRRV